MKVICAGFWKTGTKSLASALQHLGYNVYDYDYQCFELADLWDKFIDGTVTDDDIREALKDVDVIVDGPVIAYWEEISRAIPEAKVILSVRDEDSWWKSYRGMLKKVPMFYKLAYLGTFLLPSAWSFTRLTGRLNTICLGVDGPFRIPLISLDENPRMYKNAFRKHNSHVLSSVPKEKLLVLELGSGWEPICEFLGHEVPDVPYPHKNKKGGHLTEEGGPKHPAFHRIITKGILVIAVIVALLGIALFYTLSMFWG